MLMPRSRNIMVFGSWFGRKYADNSKALFEFSSSQTHVRCIWVTENIGICKLLNSLGYKSYLTNSIHGIYYQLRAKYVVISAGKKDVNRWIIGGAYIINLWHGVPLKKIMYDTERTQKSKAIGKVRELIYKYPYRHEHIVSTSDTFTDIYTHAFRVPKDRIIQLGQPRNDYFYSDEFGIELRKLLSPNERRIVLYLPTHRNEGRDLFNVSKLIDLSKVNEFCKNNNALFVIKKHFYHRNEIEPEINSLEYIIDITNEDYDTQELLASADILVTDYSSCYVDYLLLNRPVLLYCKDLREYMTCERDLYFEFSDINPGPIVDSTESLCDNLYLAFMDPKSFYRERRVALLNFFYCPKGQAKVSKELFDIVHSL